MSTYTRDEVRNHTNGIWIIIDKKIYDITSFILEHPGGQFIKKYKGTDCTTQFESRHSRFAKDLLVNYYIGDVIN